MGRSTDGFAHFMLLAFGNHFRHDFALRFLAGRLEERVSTSLWASESAYAIIVTLVFVTEPPEMNLLDRRGIDLAYTR